MLEDDRRTSWSRKGLEVSLEQETAANTGIDALSARSTSTRSARACDLAVVVGGDGTMLGIARQLARYGMPLVGINQGRLGFITDIAARRLRRPRSAPMLAGEYEEEQRTHARRRGRARRQDDLRRRSP